MNQKNRFSNLLEHLMDVAELKNYTLANELQYDVSYISKWISGKMIPSSKNETTVLQGISRCIVKEGSEKGKQILLSDYCVTSLVELQSAIYDNLVIEYNYVRETQKDTGNTVAPKTLFFPKLNMPQYISKMYHPVLRRVKSLEIMALLDLISMEKEYRLQIASIESGPGTNQWFYPDVHFSAIIDISNIKSDYIYNVIFLLNMLTNMTHIDFRLYGGKQAYGRVIFAVKDEFAISGMLLESHQCISVTVTEDPENCGTLYRSIRSLCSREHLLVRRTTMTEMITGNDYSRILISPNQRQMIGHMTEHFLPDDVFEETMNQLAENCTSPISLERLRWEHALAKQSLTELPIQLIFTETLFSEFVVSGKLDFYNLKVTLNAQQRLRTLSHLHNLVQKHDNLSVKLLHGHLVSDFQYNVDAGVFLSDSVSYLRLNSNGNRDSLQILNHPDLKTIFSRFFDEVWSKNDYSISSDRDSIVNYIEQTMQHLNVILHLTD